MPVRAVKAARRAGVGGHGLTNVCTLSTRAVPAMSRMNWAVLMSGTAILPPGSGATPLVM